MASHAFHEHELRWLSCPSTATDIGDACSTLQHRCYEGAGDAEQQSAHLANRFARP